ncbi:MAG: hypothetical protein AAF242_12700, partial [Bacteroidota bacterium]
MQFNSIFIFLLIFLFACSEQTNSPIDNSNRTSSSVERWSISSKQEWLENHGFVNVESIIYDDRNQVFYATNGTKYGPGTTGFISRISRSGELQELKWVPELNRPTGMAINDSLLYVADVNALLVVHTRTGRVINKYMEPSKNSGLNDVTIDAQGKVYVSASFIHAILHIEDGQLKLLAQDEERLKWANGLTTNTNQLLVAGLNLSTINLASGEISPVQINSTLSDFDGIAPDGNGGYFLTTVENSGLFYLNREKNIDTLLTEDIYFGDLAFTPQTQQLFIPRGNKETNTFFISVLDMKGVG